MIKSDVVVTSDGRTVTVDEWLSENVARRKTAEAKLTSIEALMPDVLILLDAMATNQRDEYARGITTDLRRVLQDAEDEQ